MDASYDVVVIGGGAAGLSGAVALSRARRAVLVVDAGQPRNAPAGHVHNYLTRDGTPPAELLAAGRAEVVRYGGEILAARAVSAVRDGDAFTVTLDDGRGVRGRRLLVTTGLVDRLPDLPGLAERWGRDVLHCPYCHGWEVRDRRIGVLSTGPVALHQARMWRQWSADVTLLSHDTPAPDAEQTEWLAARGITVVAGPVAQVEVVDDRLTGVRLAAGGTVALDALVVASRLAVGDDLLASLGLEPAEVEASGQVLGVKVPADATGATTAPGVWVAGNVADFGAQVIMSAAAGLTAAGAINADLIEEETRAAVEAYRQAAVSTAPR